MIVRERFLSGTVRDLLDWVNCTFTGSGIDCSTQNGMWGSRWSYNRQCANIADMFCCEPGSYMHALVAEIARTPASVKSDAQYIAEYRRACDQMQQAMKAVPQCGARSAAERPCSGPWGVGKPWQFPGTEAILMDALARRRSGTITDPGDVIPPEAPGGGGSLWEKAKGALFVIAVIGVLYLGFRLFTGFGTSVARRVRT